MTKEEAIEFGNMWLEINEDAKDSNTYTFFQMAIQALEQEHNIDKIRAEIKGMTPTYHNPDWTITDLVPISEVLKLIDKYKAESEVAELPSVQPALAYLPACEDCHKKMDEIRRVYDKLMEQKAVQS